MSDNGPAFPGWATDSKGKVFFGEGMKLRDWFAGMALQLWGDISGGSDVTDDMKDAARYCYQVADAMLAEREKEASHADS